MTVTLPLVGFVVGFEDERPLAVAAPRLHDLARGGQQPAAVIRRSQQGRETRSGVEPRKAKPVDRSVTRNQRRRLAVADHRVVFNSHRHV